MYVKGDAGLKLVQTILSDLRHLDGKDRPKNKTGRNPGLPISVRCTAPDFAAITLIDEISLSLEYDVLGYVHCKDVTLVSLEEKQAENVATLARILPTATATQGVMNPNFDGRATTAAWNEMEALSRDHANELKPGAGDWNATPFENPVYVDGDTLLVAAVRLGSLPHVKAVLFADDATALPKVSLLRVLRGQNNRGHNALHAAAAIGNKDIFDFLLKLEKDLLEDLAKEETSGKASRGDMVYHVNEAFGQHPLLHCKDTLGREPVIYACFWAHAHIVRAFYQLFQPVIGLNPLEGGELNRTFADIFGKTCYNYCAHGYCFYFSPFANAAMIAQARSEGAISIGAFPGCHGPEYPGLKVAVEAELNGYIYTTGVPSVDGLQTLIMAAPTALLVNPGKALFSMFG